MGPEVVVTMVSGSSWKLQGGHPVSLSALRAISVRFPGRPCLCRQQPLQSLGFSLSLTLPFPHPLSLTCTPTALWPQPHTFGCLSLSPVNQGDCGRPSKDHLVLTSSHPQAPNVWGEPLRVPHNTSVRKDSSVLLCTMHFCIINYYKLCDINMVL